MIPDLRVSNSHPRDLAFFCSVWFNDLFVLCANPPVSFIWNSSRNSWPRFSCKTLLDRRLECHRPASTFFLSFFSFFSFFFFFFFLFCVCQASRGKCEVLDGDPRGSAVRFCDFAKTKSLVSPCVRACVRPCEEHPASKSTRYARYMWRRSSACCNLSANVS